MIRLSDFEERMDAERCNFVYFQKAVKTDGSPSLKNALKCNTKSCDYIKFVDSSSLLFIEFSDLLRQKNQLQKRYINLRNYLRDTKEFEPARVIKKEIRDKFTNTFTMLFNTVNSFSSSISNMPISIDYYIAVCLNEDDLSEVMALEVLEMELKDLMAQLGGTVKNIYVVPSTSLPIF
jgi:hypothetical protein